MHQRRLINTCMLFVHMLVLVSGSSRTKRSVRDWLDQIYSPIALRSDGLCSTSNGYGIGSCMTSGQCDIRGGNALGICPESNNVCCIFVLQGSGNGNEMVTYLQNSGFPNKMTSTRTMYYWITKKNARICHLQLKFHEFSIATPESGNCLKDQFTAMGQNPNNYFPVLCGNNAGQTVYLDVSASIRPIELRMELGANAFGRLWNIELTQISCDDPQKPPSNCLQYHSEMDGSIMSFNYGAEDESGYLNNLDYTICFKKMPNACTLVLNNPDRTFGIQSNEIAFDEAGLGDSECPSDYLMVANERFCGDFLNQKPEVKNPINESAPMINPNHNEAIKDNSNGPFMVEFVSNDGTNGKGFHIEFTQLPCGYGN